MLKALYKGSMVLVKIRSTKNCRIAKSINKPTETMLVPTHELTFPETEGMLAGLFFPDVPKPKPPGTPTYADLHEEYLKVMCGLSPENLSCDGEASATYIKRRRKELMAIWAELNQKLQRTVTEDEVWSYERAHPRTGPKALSDLFKI